MLSSNAFLEEVFVFIDDIDVESAFQYVAGKKHNHREYFCY